MDLTRWYPTGILIAWFGIFATFFVIIPAWMTWLYIIGLPTLIIYDIYRQRELGTLQAKFGSIDALMIAYAVYVMASIFLTPSLPLNTDVYVSEVLFRVVVPLTIYWFVRINPIPDEQFKYWIYFLAIVIVIETIFGFITLFAPTILPESYQPRPVHLYKRATGTFVTPSNYVLQLFVGIVFLFYYIRKLAPSRERLLLILVVIIGIIGVLISQNRGGWLILSLMILVLVYLEPSFGRWLFGAIAIFVVITLVVRPSFFTQSFNRLTEWRQIESRITMGVAGVELFLEKPLLGWGYGTYDLHDWRYMRQIGSIEPTRYEISVATSHNTYLTIASELGIIGFILYVLPTLLLLLRTVLAYFKERLRRDWDLVFLMWLLIVVIHIAAQFADFRFFPFILGYWWLAMAIIANELQWTVFNRLPQNSS